ncbi:ankyrin repeat-containing domain protein, partial [Lasiosphaeria ovina]
RTVLMEAAGRGRDTIVRFLLEGQHCTQARIDYDSGKGTAANMAAANGYELVLRILAARTAPDVIHPLISVAQFRQAAIVGDNEVVSRILNSDVLIDVPDSDRYTPFLHSVENNKKETVKFLLDHAGDRISINRKCLSTALIIASVNGYEEIVELLLRCDCID